MSGEVWYRVEDYRESTGFDEWGESLGCRPRVRVMEFQKLKDTPKGVWLRRRFGSKNKWVSKTSKKRYAYPTKQEATESFLARKNRQIAILQSQLEHAKEVELIGKRMQERLNDH